MQTLESASRKKRFALICKAAFSNCKTTFTILLCTFLLTNSGINAQTTCLTALTITPSNTNSCTPGTAFNVNAIGTGTAFSSCATGIASPLNKWGKFVANSSTAKISYAPPSNRDAMIFAYSGSCPTPTQIGCVDSYGDGGIETLNLTGLTAGSTYFFRIVAYNRNSGNMNGNVCVASPYSIVTGTISGSPFCAGASISVPFTSFGIFFGNTYSAQLSDASGSFSSATTIGTLISNANSGTISATLPVTASGTGYRIRVISNGPTVTGTNNGTNITINTTSQGVFSGSTICSGVGTAELTFTASSGTGPFTVIYNDGLFDRTKTNVTSGVSFAPALTPIITSNYTLVSVTDVSGCARTSGFTDGTATITFSIAPTIAASSTAADRCQSSTSQTSDLSYSLTSGSPDTYSITWDAAALSAGLANSGSLTLTSSPVSVAIAAGVAAGTYNGTLTVTNADNCSSSGTNFTVTIKPTPAITTASTADTRCFSSSYQNGSLTYSSTTNSPTSYNITWNAAALTAGLTNVTNAAISTSPLIFPVPAGVAAGTYTGTVTVTNSVSCTSASNSFTFTITPAPSINTQPISQTVCSGTSVSLSIAATGTSLTYQWRKGTTNLCNCGNTSGVTTSTLLINPVNASNAASNYNCVVTSNGCASVISDYATITVTAAAVTPTTNPGALVFPTVSTTSILASFTAAADATHYLVIRKTSNVAPTNPVNGTTYSINSSALTGIIDYAGTNNTFTSNGLTPGTTYYYWIFPYNVSTCGTSPVYFTSTPLNGNATTATNVSCGTVTTLYWGGTGSGLSGAVSGTDFNTAANWSTSGSSYVASPASPTNCNNVSMALVNAATITLSSNASVYGLTYTLQGDSRSATLSMEGNTLTVNSNAVIDVLSGNSSTYIYIGENSAGAGTVDFKANFKIGETNYGSNVPRSNIVGNVNSRIIFRGDVLFGRTARVNLPGGSGYPPSYPIAAPGTGTTPGTILFDGIGIQQVLWNNDAFYDCFYNIIVGNENRPYVKHVTGTYTPDNILNNFTINDGCTVDLGTSQWIREQTGGTFTMNGTAKLILGNYRSIRSAANTGGLVTGSNFPGGFSTMNISANSTIEYNGGNSITQTVYATPAYGNLILSNIDGTGTANKISTATVTVNGTAAVANRATFTPGTTVVIQGTANVQNGGTWVSGSNITSGTGAFNLQSGGTLSMASAAGITASGATGNIQTSSRIFSTGGNYTYNGSAAQATGNGLPTTVNNLTISNTNGVTIYAAAANYTVAGTLALNSGALTINGNTLTINNLTRTSGTLTGSATSSVGVTGTSIPLFFTSGGRILKDLTIHNNASADIQTALDITAGSNAGSVAVGSSSTLNTYGYLTLKSDANGTARVAEIPVNGSGTALGNINGNVMIERYIPARRAWRIITAPVQSSGSQTINEAWQEGVVNNSLTNNQNPTPGFGIHISGSSAALGFDVTPLNNPSMRVYNRATTSFVGIANTLSTRVRDYEGYMVFVRGNRSTDLTLNTNAPLSNTVVRESGGLRMGRQSVTLASTAGSYSLVGNPYPSTIDFRTLSITGAGTTSSFVMWDPALTGAYGVGAYQYFTQSGGSGSNYEVFPGGGSYGVAGTVNNFVQSGQAFLVANSGAATLIINESSKAASSTSAVFRPMPDNITGKISTILYKKEADSSMTVLDGGLVMYRSEYNDDITIDDVKKMNNTNSENFGLNKNAVIYQIEKRQTINETDTIYYNMRNLNPRNYQLEIELKNIDAAGMKAYLKDNFTGVTTMLEYNTINKFAFSPTAAQPGSYAPDRFNIFFKQMSVLPVTFTSLEAVRNNNKINVEWKIENESNIKHYEVEKSTDGIHFSKQSTNINAGNRNLYQWVDEQPLQGINYFRVKAVGNNGRSQYTNIAKVFFGKNATGITVFPNPVIENKINLYFNGEEAGNYIVNLFSNNGQLVKTTKLPKMDGNGNISIDIEKGLPHGNYILEVIKPDLSKEHINIVY